MHEKCTGIQCEQDAVGVLSSFAAQFTIRFLDRYRLPHNPGPQGMQQYILAKIAGPGSPTCADLWSYIDELRLWGKQHVFLFELNGNRKQYTKDLKDPEYIKERLRKRGQEDVYGNDICYWKPSEVTLAQVKHTHNKNVNARQLIFKWIETREFRVEQDNILTTCDERSTNFFVVNLRNGYAELRLQRLPPFAIKNVQEEKRILEEEISRYLDYRRFTPVSLQPVMEMLLRKKIFPITGLTVTTSRNGETKLSKLYWWLIKGFSGTPSPSWVSARWFGLYFALFRIQNRVDFGGVADASRVDRLLKRIVGLRRNYRPLGTGMADPLIEKFKSKPATKPAILSAGAIAMSPIWIIIKKIGSYGFEEWFERTFEVSFALIQIAVEVIWIIKYYGWNRIIGILVAPWNFVEFVVLKVSKVFKR